MAWPQSQDFNEAIQTPATSFGDPELRRGQPVTNALGMPMPRSGNFADVYEFQGASGQKWALKCFTRQIPGLHERYQAISKHLAQAKLPFFVDFEYLPRGIRVRGEFYPLLKMHWVDGFLLNEFVRDNLEKPAILNALSQIWLKMAQGLREAGIAHADLQHGNVIFIPATNARSLSVRLIDYDGMWVPALSRSSSGEVGHPCFQHPQRIKESTYNAAVDRLPLLTVACALRCLGIGGKALWEKYDNGDNLLFREADLRNPSTSKLFKELWNLGDPTAHDLIGFLADGLTHDINQAPFLLDLIAENHVRPLSAMEENRAAKILGPSVIVRRPPAAAKTPTKVLVVAPTPAPPKKLSPINKAVAMSPPDWNFEDMDDSSDKRVVNYRRSGSRSLLVGLTAMFLVMVIGGSVFYMLQKLSRNKTNEDVAQVTPAKAPPNSDKGMVPKKTPPSDEKSDPFPPKKTENQPSDDPSDKGSDKSAPPRKEPIIPKIDIPSKDPNPPKKIDDETKKNDPPLKQPDPPPNPPIENGEQEEDEFIPLFNGQNKDDWKPFASQNSGIWHVKEGALVASGAAVKSGLPFSFIYTKKNRYEDFHLKLEAWVNGNGACDVCLRTPHGNYQGQDPKFTNGYGVRINCSHKDPYKPGSLLYTLGKVETPLQIVEESPVPAGKWFKMEIIAVGNIFLVNVDGKNVVNYTDPTPRYQKKGHIALRLQGSDTEVKIRAIEIRDFLMEEAAKASR